MNYTAAWEAAREAGSEAGGGVQRRLQSDVAYGCQDGSVFLDISVFPAYGRLSQLDRRQLKAGARVASDEFGEDDPRDFALWKKTDAMEEQVGAAWDSPFGRGRP